MFKIITSLEKCFLDDSISTKASLKSASLLKNEVYRFGACYTADTLMEGYGNKRVVLLDIQSPLAAYIRVWKVDHVPVKSLCNIGHADADYLRTKPGLFPDLLTPLREDKRLMIHPNLESLYFECSPNGQAAAGKYPVAVRLLDEASGEVVEQATLTLEIIDAALPEQEMKVTQWFHCDCLQNYYNTGNFDERHWEIIENFMRTAVEHGINMLLTPIITPPLDTHFGGERQTAQLVDVTLTDGQYTFGFEKLSRWVDLCDKVGVKYFEIAHLFSQWGLGCAAKVMATVDGEYKRLFGWETSALSEEYRTFLRALIPQLLAFMKSKNGADRRCWFHVMDEPALEHLEMYQSLRDTVADLLEGYPMMDALSNYEFYEKGVLQTPIPSTDHIEAFLENKVPNLWCYYCIGQAEKTSNRFISMPGSRTRIIGTQFYKYDIVGFLQWGYNFYNNQGSYGTVNPYVCTDGEYFAPAGDTFSVYPGMRGEALPSMRLKLFHDGLQDVAALKLCERLYDKAFVLSLMEEGEEPITFSEYPRDITYLPALREKVNAAIKAKL